MSYLLRRAEVDQRLAAICNIPVRVYQRRVRLEWEAESGGEVPI